MILLLLWFALSLMSIAAMRTYRVPSPQLCGAACHLFTSKHSHTNSKSLCLQWTRQRSRCIHTVHTMPVPALYALRRSFSSQSDLSDQEYYGNTYVEQQQLDVTFDHITQKSSQITDYWIDVLRTVDRPSAVNLIRQLVPDNPLGFEGVLKGPAKKGTLVDFAIEQKKKHLDKVVLLRCGEFYETYGVDAILMVACAGLNPMGNKCKAGCPRVNIQSTLDALTGAGLSVAVYEEAAEPSVAQAGASSSRAKIKTRFLAQIVSPACGTYLHPDLCLKAGDIEFREGRPAIGITRTSHGLTLCQVDLSEKTVCISARLTEEAVRALIDTSGYIEPVYTQDAADLAFLQGHTEQLEGYSEYDFISQVQRRIGQAFEVDTRTFRVTNRSSSDVRPIYSSTASQIGLGNSNDKNVPSLVSALLPRLHSAHSARFFKKWLLLPPPYEVGDQMRSLCRVLSSNASLNIPSFVPISIAKIVSLISARECNTDLFASIRDNLRSLQYMLRQCPNLTSGEEDDDYVSLVAAMLRITSYESGIPAERVQLLRGCSEILVDIDAVVADRLQQGTAEDDCFRDKCDRRRETDRERLNDFFSDNERVFRNKLSPANPIVVSVYRLVDEAAQELCSVLTSLFPDERRAMSHSIVYDRNENAIMLELVQKKGRRGVGDAAAVTPDDSGSAVDESLSPPSPLVPYIDRKGKPTKYKTTLSLITSLHRYISVVAYATAVTSELLRELSGRLEGSLVSIVQASHWAVVLKAAMAHSEAARQKGWILPQMVDDDAIAAATTQRALHLTGLSPYWMDRSSCEVASIRLVGLFLLTAPNMSGKSTLMRSVLVAALLANCGLFVPCSQATVPRFDKFFLRTASYDIPSEQKSAFASEMDDMRVMLRDCSSRSLLMIDELGKGTSARDGSALAGALLEHLDARQVSGVFATHLHELFQLPLHLQHTTEKRMGFNISADGTGEVRWTYTLEDGRCTDSMALNTAKQYGIDRTIVDRAEVLGAYFDQCCREGSRAEIELHLQEQLRFAEDQQQSVQLQHLSSADIDDSAGIDTDIDIDRDLLPAVRHLVDDSPLYVVKRGFEPSPALEGLSCSYILLLSTLTKAQKTQLLYVGETESIRSRLEQHRQRTDYLIECVVVVPAQNKSRARRTETDLIKMLRRENFPLLNTGDGGHVLFSNE